VDVGVRLPDSPLNYHDVWATLGALAASTERIGLPVSVTNLVSRPASVTACAARTLATAIGLTRVPTGAWKGEVPATG
jgi:alkanesulfonate monooxygenase SsuD/methylene tetrahydromethanopterin reductase-like flavin-dependent oxidoreductase (luciferase family)